MGECVVAGRRYRVVGRDNIGFFKDGEIVVALEDDNVPYCVRECDYEAGKAVADYDSSQYSPLIYPNELKEIE